MATKQAPDWDAAYRATAEPAIVEVPAFDFAIIDGVGDPATAPDYKAAVAGLYAYSYPVVIITNKTRAPKLKVGPLEGLWWAEDYAVFDPTQGDRTKWHWQMMIRQPSHVPESLIAAARSKVAKKMGADLASRLRLERFTEGRCAQLLHVGAYTEEGPAIARLHDYIAASGLALRGRHHEIYLNDPTKTAPAKLRTILRQPVE